MTPMFSGNSKFVYLENKMKCMLLFSWTVHALVQLVQKGTVPLKSPRKESDETIIQILFIYSLVFSCATGVRTPIDMAHSELIQVAAILLLLGTFIIFICIFHQAWLIVRV